MDSLRARPPQGRPGGQRLAKPSPATPRNAATRKSTRIDDKIKKRMSMRYADISAPTDAVGIPNVPALPVALSTGKSIQPTFSLASDEQAGAGRAPEEIGSGMLETDDFHPSTYLKTKLSNSTEAEIQSLQSSLAAAKSTASSDLRQSVVKNYAEFFALSKEISTLENDLLELKDSLSEWRSMPSLLHVDSSIPIERRRTNRSSVADLRVLYANQIAALHSRIEGSSKFVQAMPGRHIVFETSDITSLNVATYKPELSIHFVLLDDALLISKKRKRRDDREEKLSAMRCWNLVDIAVMDVKDTSDLRNVFKIKDGKLTHVYRADRLADKKAFLASFREVAEDFAARKRKQRETEHERRKSVWAPSDRSSVLIPTAVPSLPAWLQEMAKEDPSHNTNRSEQDTAWLTQFQDDLAVAVALKDWDEAVSLTETGEERLSAFPELAARLPTLKASLTRSLLAAFTDSHHRKAKVTHMSSLLIRLGAGIAARSTFLATRTQLLRKRTRSLAFDGDTVLYISDLSTVVFTIVKHSADWYFGSFRDHENASTFVQWAKEQIQVFVDIFKSQVYQTDITRETAQKCIQITRMHSKRLLGENGLDFSFLMEQILTSVD